jgi:hypothetical protein
MSYIRSNNFYRSSKLWFEKQVRILVGNYSNTPANSLVVGDGDKLLINPEGTDNVYTCSRIAACDMSSSGFFTSNQCQYFIT